MMLSDVFLTLAPLICFHKCKNRFRHFVVLDVTSAQFVRNEYPALKWKSLARCGRVTVKSEAA